jgi:hypothetical protein
MLGGNYPALAFALEEYILRLRKGGVELLVTLDPAHGTEDDDKKEVCIHVHLCAYMNIYFYV